MFFQVPFGEIEHSDRLSSHIVATCSPSVCLNQVRSASHYTFNICQGLGVAKITADVAAMVLGWADTCRPPGFTSKTRRCIQTYLWHHWGNPNIFCCINLNDEVKLCLAIFEPAYLHVCVLHRVALKGQGQTSGRRPGTRSPRTPAASGTAFPPFICKKG